MVGHDSVEAITSKPSLPFCGWVRFILGNSHVKTAYKASRKNYGQVTIATAIKQLF